MMREKHFFLHSLRLVLSRISVSVTGVLFWWLALRLYSVDDVGLASVLLSTASLLIFIACLGTVPTLVRFMKRPDKDRILGSLLMFSLLMLFSLSLLFALFQRFLVPSLTVFHQPLFMLLFVAATLPLLLLLVSEGIFVSFSQTTPVLMMNLVQNVGRLGLQFLFIAWGGLGIFLSNSVAGAIAVIVAFLRVRKKQIDVKIPLALDRKLLGELLPFSFFNFLNGLALSIPGLVFPLIIFSVLSSREAGFFYVSWNIFYTFLGFVISIHSVFLMQGSSGEDLARVGKKSLLLTMALAAFCFVFVLFEGKPMLRFFKPDLAEGAFRTLMVFCVSLFFVNLNQFFVIVHNIRRRMHIVGVVSLSVIALTVTLGAFLLSRIGVEGIAWAWLLSHVLATIALALDMLISRRKPPLQPSPNRL